jgi:hypothetical protein
MNRNNYYYISITYNNEFIDYDENISKLLNITYHKYIKLLKLYNAQNSIYEYCFIDKKDCEKCIEYIKQQYNNRLVYLTLLENTNEANKIISELNDCY